jgi:hypothetical protein
MISTWIRSQNSEYVRDMVPVGQKLRSNVLSTLEISCILGQLYGFQSVFHSSLQLTATYRIGGALISN